MGGPAARRGERDEHTRDRQRIRQAVSVGLTGLFEEWLRSLPMRRPFGLNEASPGEDLIRVDELREDNTQVIRAELPGIDPDKDVEITVCEGVLRINAERRVEEKTQGRGLHAA